MTMQPPATLLAVPYRSHARSSLVSLVLGLTGLLLAETILANEVDAGYESPTTKAAVQPRWQAPLLGASEAALRSKSNASVIVGFRDQPVRPRGFDADAMPAATKTSSAKQRVLTQLAEWGVKPRHVYDDALDGFVATLSREQIEWLRALPEVAFVEVEQIGQLDATYQVPDALWHLDRIDQARLPLDRKFTVANTGAFANVYVIDSGIYSAHNDFKDALGRSRVSKVFSIAGLPGEDCLGHGTNVASVIAGRTHGVAKSAKVFDARVANCSGQIRSGDVTAALDAIAEDVRVNRRERVIVNMSLGFKIPPSFERAMLRMSAQNILFVTSAGNDGTSGGIYERAINQMPARLGAGTSVINVGATDRSDRRAAWSNYGYSVNLMAPGDGIRMASVNGPDSVWTDSGTSFAGPAVAGTAAVCLTADASITPADMKNRLVNCAHRNVLSSVSLNGTNRMLNVDACGCSASPQFLDMAVNHWAYSTVSCLSKLGVGFPSGIDRYQPDEPMKRWEMAVFMVQAMREEGNIPAEYKAYFSDALTADWWTPYVERFKELGITAGCGSNKYCPNDNVKRWQMAIFLVKSLGEQPTASHRGYFADVGVSHPQRGFIERLYELGVTAGEVVNGRRYFRPDNDTTRAQIASFMRAGSTVRTARKPYPQALTCS